MPLRNFTTFFLDDEIYSIYKIIIFAEPNSHMLYEESEIFLQKF